MIVSQAGRDQIPIPSAPCSQHDSLGILRREDIDISASSNPLPALAGLSIILDYSNDLKPATTPAASPQQQTPECLWDLFQNLQTSYNQLETNHQELKEEHGQALCEIASVRQAGVNVLESRGALQANYLQEMTSLRATCDILEAEIRTMKLEREQAFFIEAKLAVEFRQRQDEHEHAIAESKEARLQAFKKLAYTYMEIGKLKAQLDDTRDELATYVANSKAESAVRDSELSSAVEQLKSLKNDHAQELDESRAHISRLETDVSMLQRRLDEAHQLRHGLVSKTENEKTTMLEKTSKLETTYETSLAHLKAEHEDAIKTLETRLRDADSISEKLRQDNKANKAKLSSAELTVDKYSTEKNGLQVKYEASEARIKSLEKVVKDLKRRNEKHLKTHHGENWFEKELERANRSACWPPPPTASSCRSGCNGGR